MDMNKILQWMDLAKKYQSSDFWNGIFEQSSFDDFMKGFDGERSGDSPFEPGKGKNFPPTDIYLTEESVLLVVELAGYSKDDIQLSVSGTKLLIKGSSSQVIRGEPVQQERHQGEFKRMIQLPEPTYPNQIRAKFKDGLLIISYKRQFKTEEHVPIE